MSNEFYVYIYFDPSRDMEPIYVGKGKGKRAQSHLKRNDQTLFSNRLKHMRNNGVEPIIERYENLEEAEALDLEKNLILSIGRKINSSGPLLNITEGGEGCSGMIHSDEAKAKIGNKAKGNQRWLGRKHTDEAKAKISKASRNLVHTDESKAKISKASSGKKHTEESKAKLSKSKLGVKKPDGFADTVSAIVKSREPVKCPHCGKIGDVMNMKRWHFDKCKFNNLNK